MRLLRYPLQSNATASLVGSTVESSQLPMVPVWFGTAAETTELSWHMRIQASQQSEIRFKIGFDFEYNTPSYLLLESKKFPVYLRHRRHRCDYLYVGVGNRGET